MANASVTKEMLIDEVFNRARKNIDKWGMQDIKTIALAIAEESGEIAQAVLKLKHEKGTKNQVVKEVYDLLPLCIQLMWSLEEG